MRAFLSILFILSGTSPARADSLFQEAFEAKAKLHRNHQEQLVLPFRFELDEITKTKNEEALKAEETRLQEHFAASLERTPRSDWDKKFLRILRGQEKLETSLVNKEAVDHFTEEFPKIKNFDLAEWELVGELFGPKTQAALVKLAFSLQELTVANAPKATTGGKVLWIRSAASFELDPSQKPDRKKTENWQKLLAKQGFQLEVIDLNPFGHIDDQAEELRHILSERQNNPAILLSFDLGSAVVYRALDLFPGMRKSELIQGWLNINGKLFGQAPDARRPASVDDPNERLKASAKAELHLLYREGLHRPTPLVPGFPIINVTTDYSEVDLRNRIVGDGESWYVKNGAPDTALTLALPLFGNPAPGSALRDNLSGP